MSEPFFIYRAKARPWGLFKTLSAAVFGLGLGVVLLINPFRDPPARLAWMPPLIGVLFVGGGLWEIRRGLRLMRDPGGWHVEVNAERVVYRTPAASRERSFALAIPDIRSVTVEYQSADSDAEHVRYLTTTAGETIPFGHAETLFNADAFIHALRKAGVPIIERARE